MTTNSTPLRRRALITSITLLFALAGWLAAGPLQRAEGQGVRLASGTGSAGSAKAAGKGGVSGSHSTAGHATEAGTTGTTSADATSADKIPVPPVRSVNCARAKCIALTFDDGPGPYTDRLLSTLASKRVPATFFVIGRNVGTRPDTLRRVVAAGHQVGSHTYSHADLSKLSRRQIAQELTSTNEAIRKAVGFRPTTMRPPYGASDADVTAETKRLGLPQIRWSVDPYDWRDRNTGLVTRRVLAGARPGGIVLMHDIHETTVAAVPAIIDGLKKQGYTLVRVDQLLGQMKPGQSYSQR